VATEADPLQSFSVLTHPLLLYSSLRQIKFTAFPDSSDLRLTNSFGLPSPAHSPDEL
jgi:hypothetical protein